MTATRSKSFGADVGRNARGRFIRLPPVVERGSEPLHIRLARAKAQQQQAEEIPVQRYRTTFAEMWRKVFG